jgi:hypothetical protein
VLRVGAAVHVGVTAEGEPSVFRAGYGHFRLAYGIPHGAWCPNGRRVEDGVVQERCGLRVTATSSCRIQPLTDVAQRSAAVMARLGASFRSCNWLVQHTEYSHTDYLYQLTS